MDDLITRLTAAIDGLTALAQRVRDAFVVRNPDHERDGEPYWPTPRVEAVYRQYGPGGAQAGLDLIKACSPDVVLRGCAADRKILAIHRPIETFNGLHIEVQEKLGRAVSGVMICERCANNDKDYGWDDHDEDVQYPCPTLRAVADRYGLEDTDG